MSTNVMIPLVVLSILSMYSTVLVNKTINHDLLYKWDINFTFWAADFEDDILNCFDSYGNYLRVYVTRRADKKSVVMVYNKHKNRLTVLQFCGCSNCANERINMLVKLENGQLRGRCNNHRTFPFYIDSFKEGSVRSQFVNFSIGRYFRNKENIFAGCLNYFYFNDKLLTFTREDNDNVKECEVIATTLTSTKYSTISYVSKNVDLNGTSTNGSVTNGNCWSPSTTTQCFYWQKIAIGNTIVIAILIAASIGQDRMTNFVQKIKWPQPLVEISMHETRSQHNSLYSSLHEGIDSSIAQPLDVSIGTYLVPRNAPLVPPRAQSTNYRRNNWSLHDQISTMYSSLNGWVQGFSKYYNSGSEKSRNTGESQSLSDDRPSLPPRVRSAVYKSVEGILHRATAHISNNSSDNYQRLIDSVPNATSNSMCESELHHLDGCVINRSESGGEDRPSLPPRDNEVIFKNNC